MRIPYERPSPVSPPPPEVLRTNLGLVQQLVARVEPGQIYLVSGPRRLVSYVSQELVDRLAMRGPVYVIVGGNRFSLEQLPLLLSHQPALLEAALQRTYLTRAETCYQLQDALESTQPAQSPLIVTDLLRTLCEDDIDDAEAARLLGICLRNLRRLSEHTPVVVSAAERAERPQLLEGLRAAVDDEVRLLLAAPEPAPQPELFPEA